MAFVSKLTPEQWAEARKLREDGATYAAISREFGVGASAVRRRALIDGWAEPVADPGDGPASEPAPSRPLQPLSLSAASTAVRRTLARRIYRIVELNLRIMELRVQRKLEDAMRGKGDLAIDEQDVSRIGSLIKTTEQATELEADAEPSAGGAPGGKSTDAQARDVAAEALRREIAERIETLVPPA